MTNATLVDMLVKNGMTVAEAVEAVGYNEGLSNVVDYMAEEAEYAKAQQYAYDWATIKAMNRDERNALYRLLNSVLEGASGITWDIAYESYCELSAIEDDEYYAENIEAFIEYESHMDEPDFDWGFYSDWHKDMYGFRPR